MSEVCLYFLQFPIQIYYTDLPLSSLGPVGPVFIILLCLITLTF